MICEIRYLMIVCYLSCVYLSVFSILLYTINMTARHWGPKQKLQAGYRVLSLQRTSYLCITLLCCTHYMFHHWVCYRALSLCYACIRSSGIVLIP